MLELRILGPPDFRRSDGQPLTAELLGQSKRFALLAYLALEGQGGSARRDIVLALFWPELDQRHAAAALRQSLYVLRGIIGTEAVFAHRQRMGVDSEYLWCDASAFQSELDAGHLVEALALYRGPLLAGFHAGDTAPEFEQWLEQRRTELERRALQAANSLSLQAIERGDTPEAARWAWRGLEIDPMDEDMLRRLLVALDAAGDRRGAARAYDTFARRLDEEIGVLPAAETQALLQAIRDRREAAYVPSLAQGSPPTVTGAPHETGPSTQSRAGPQSTESRTRRRLAYGGLLIGLLVGAFWLSRDEAAPRSSTSAPTVAVLPFRTFGPHTTALDEGLMDLVSINLQGLSTLYAIESRDLVERWRRQSREDGEAGSPDGLAVARDAEATYAVLGSAVGGASRLRLSAEVYDVDRRERLNTVTVEGHPDSLLLLVDRLSIGILRALAPQELTPGREVVVARLTTSSVPAMRAYLEGERARRRSRFDEAILHYQQAVEIDSLFMLALWRLAHTYGYAQLEELQMESMVRLEERLEGGSMLLPDRELLLVRGELARMRGDPSMVPQLVEAARKYPRDPEVWHILAESYYHLGRYVLAGPDEVNRALRTTLNLDPGFTPAYVHLINLAFNIYGDSAYAAELTARYERQAPGSDLNIVHSLALGIVYGDGASRARAESALDTLTHDPVLLLGTYYLNHPASTRHRERIVHRLREYPGMQVIAARLLVHSSISRGRTRELLERLEDPEFQDGDEIMWLYLARMMGMKLPDSLLTAAAEELPGELETNWFYAGAAAVELEQWAAHARAIEALGAYARQLRAAGDSLQAEFYFGAAEGLEGYGLWKRGHHGRAIPVLRRAQRRAAGTAKLMFDVWSVNGSLRLWLGELYRNTGRSEEALRYYEPFGMDQETGLLAPALLGRARALESLGRNDAASRAYSQFALVWRDADPELRPLVDRARAAAARLSSAGP